MSSKMILSLYKEMLREASKFNSYYYKNYFSRKIKTQFRKHIVADEETSLQLIKKSEDMLQMLRRQTLITNTYGESRLVIENPQQEPKVDTKTVNQ